jgi:acyl carrier protein
MGRKDSLVKIRGHRVALSEVEAALLELPAIKETIVLPDEELSVDRSLVAYVVPSPLLTPSITELRDELSVNLPQHMIPSVFVFIEELPLTPIGKVDRIALPKPGNARPELETPLVFARTPMEQEVSNIWSKLLSVRGIGAYDSFLDLGGDSLLAIQIINRIRSKFGVELKIEMFFQRETTIEWMANYISTSRD